MCSRNFLPSGLPQRAMSTRSSRPDSAMVKGDPVRPAVGIDAGQRPLVIEWLPAHEQCTHHLRACWANIEAVITRARQARSQDVRFAHYR